MMVSDEQIKSILDLTTHAPRVGSIGTDQREGMDTFLGTDEELIADVRQCLEGDFRDEIKAVVREVLLSDEFLAAFAKRFLDSPVPTYAYTPMGDKP